MGNRRTNTFAATLLRVREAARIPAQRLAAEAGLHRHTIARWEAHQSEPRADAVRRVVAVLAARDPAGAREVALASDKLEVPAAPEAKVSAVTSAGWIGVLYAAAEAGDVSPRALRAALLTTFERVRDAGGGLDALEAFLRGAKGT